MEAVHLRFGAIARGGLRWSDRREDFRDEILGLAKSQAIKNAVIVPDGAKGGFVLRNPPADREEISSPLELPLTARSSPLCWRLPTIAVARKLSRPSMLFAAMVMIRT